MSDHSVMRRRLAALDEAIRLLSEEWAATEDAGPVSHYSDLTAGNARKASGAPGDECWLTAFGAVTVLREIRATVHDMTHIAEGFAATHGVSEWHPAGDMIRPEDRAAQPEVKHE